MLWCFCFPATNSYEEMPENPKVADETSCLQNPVISISHETHSNFQDDKTNNSSDSESYDDVDKVTDGEVE